jgi:hypothetical protein
MLAVMNYGLGLYGVRGWFLGCVIMIYQCINYGLWNGYPKEMEKRKFYTWRRLENGCINH